jgi:hypothetical protein
MINEYVEKIMRNGITHFAEQLQKPTADIQILILWDKDSESVKYKKMVRGSESVYVKFNEILNVKFDLMNREALCGSFITNTLKKYSNEFSCDVSQLFVVIYHLEDEEKDIRLFLYRNTEAIKEIELEEILSR